MFLALMGEIVAECSETFPVIEFWLAFDRSLDMMRGISWQ